MNTNLEKIVEVAELLQEDKAAVFVRPKKSIQNGIRMSLEAEEVAFDTEELQKIALNMILEYLTYQGDNSFRTNLLKNTQFKGAMLLDGIKRNLPQYCFLKCAVIDNDLVSFVLKDPLNEDAINTLVDSLDGSYKATKKETTSKSRRKYTQVSFDGVPALSISEYAVSIPYRDLLDKENKDIALSVKSVTELVTRIHQDVLFKNGIRKVNLAEYAPIFKMLFPEAYKDNLSGALKIIRTATLDNKIQDAEEFHETKKSTLYESKDKRYALHKECLLEHMQYAIVCPAKKEMYIRFSSNLDFSEIANMLKAHGLKLSDPEKKRNKCSITIQKGGGARNKKFTNAYTQRNIVDEENKVIASLSGNNSLTLYLGQDDKTFEKAASVASQIYYDRLFYTSWMRTAELESDLSETERRVIGTIDTFTSLYRTFLEVEEGKLAFAQGKKHYSPLGWVTVKMQESASDNFNERLLHVVNEIDERVTPSDFYKHGSAKETQERLQQRYALLQQVKGKCEAVCRMATVN